MLVISRIIIQQIIRGAYSQEELKVYLLNISTPSLVLLVWHTGEPHTFALFKEAKAVKIFDDRKLPYICHK